ncbi:MAG: polyprenol monophosphomannose synthase [Patescibacteria group bacterium]
MGQKTVIILPTYNERENLPGIVADILQAVPDNAGIIVVDDNSPDGTGAVADGLARNNSRIHVLHRTRKAGLGRAYLAGFQEALKDPEAEYIFEMDADFSHQPKYIPDFLSRAHDADLVLGSRYIAGGGVENWSWWRHAISWFANWTIRKILGIRVSDLTGGYKCFRRRVLERLDLGTVQSNGYNFQIEVTYLARQAGFRIAEVPIIFIERRAGLSKFNASIILESFWQVLKLRFRKPSRTP